LRLPDRDDGMRQWVRQHRHRSPELRPLRQPLSAQRLLLKRIVRLREWRLHRTGGHVLPNWERYSVSLLRHWQYLWRHHGPDHLQRDRLARLSG
jgi:hypothetical protein